MCSTSDFWIQSWRTQHIWNSHSPDDQARAQHWWRECNWCWWWDWNSTIGRGCWWRQPYGGSGLEEFLKYVGWEEWLELQRAGKRHWSKRFTVYCTLAHKGLSSTHTYKWQRKNGVINIITLPKLSETWSILLKLFPDFCHYQFFQVPNPYLFCLHTCPTIIFESFENWDLLVVTITHIN